MLSLSYGFIKIFKTEYDKLCSKLSKNLLITTNTGLKTVNILNCPINKTAEVKKTIESYLVNSGLPCGYAKVKIYDYMISSLIFSEWTDTFILNNNEYEIYNIAQAMVDVKNIDEEV
jgi:hypothetical protein